jgi:hypothetical protein
MTGLVDLPDELLEIVFTYAARRSASEPPWPPLAAWPGDELTGLHPRADLALLCKRLTAPAQLVVHRHLCSLWHDGYALRRAFARQPDLAHRTQSLSVSVQMLYTFLECALADGGDELGVRVLEVHDFFLLNDDIPLTCFTPHLAHLSLGECYVAELMDLLRLLPQLVTLAVGKVTDDGRDLEAVDLPRLTYFRADLLTADLVDAIVACSLPSLRSVHIAGRVGRRGLLARLLLERLAAQIEVLTVRHVLLLR